MAEAVCPVCFRHCRLKDGQTGFCRARKNQGGQSVCLNYGKPEQKDLDRMTLAEAKRYCAEGHFKPGSMLPKIQAVIAFLEGGGREAIITDPAHLGEALAGRTGTHVVP